MSFISCFISFAIAELFLKIHQNSDNLQNYIDKTYKILEPKFYNSTYLKMYWQILQSQLAEKNNNQELLQKSAKELKELEKKFPNDYFSIQNYIKNEFK